MYVLKLCFITFWKMFTLTKEKSMDYFFIVIYFTLFRLTPFTKVKICNTFIKANNL